MPTFGSLFSGIGGLDLGLERAGWQCRWQVEIDEWCRRVLARHWPDVPRFGDVREFEPVADAKGEHRQSDSAGPSGAGEREVSRSAEERRPRRSSGGSRSPWAVDLICGGFPCQPVSLAGKRRGQDDDRWLWPEFARIVRLLRPRYVLVENVPGLLARGMGDVLGDLAACGYDTEWDCIPAAAVGAPHLRYRVFIVAYQADASRSDADGFGSHRARIDEHRGVELRHEQVGESRPLGEDVADAEGKPGALWPTPGQRLGRPASGGTTSPNHDGAGWADTQGSAGSTTRWRSVFGPNPARLGSDQWLIEPDVGRVAHGVPHRVDRLRGLGNAVVPQVAEWIGRRLMEAM